MSPFRPRILTSRALHGRQAIRGGRAVRCWVTLLCGILACLAWAAQARAQGAQSPNVQLRLYVNAFTAGKIDKTGAMGRIEVP